MYAIILAIIFTLDIICNYNYGTLIIILSLPICIYLIIALIDMA